MRNEMRSLVLAILASCSLFIMSTARAEDVSQDNKFALQRCRSNEIGISFDCDPSWKLNRQLKTLKITIQQTPFVEMIIEENDQAMHFISELTEEAFASTGRYEKGFNFEHLTYCERETIKINGYLKDHPETRVSDFYLIDHNRVHSIKFTVSPKEAWEDYKWLVKDIMDSMRFIKQTTGTKLLLDKTDETCDELINKDTDTIQWFNLDQARK